MGFLSKQIIAPFIPAAAWTVIIVVLSLMPSNDLPESPFFNIPHFDKLVHAGMYFILASLLVYPLRKTKFPVYITILVFTLFLGGALEIIQQTLTSSRTGSWYDLLADVLGTAGGLFCINMLLKGNSDES